MSAAQNYGSTTTGMRRTTLIYCVHGRIDCCNETNSNLEIKTIECKYFYTGLSLKLLIRKNSYSVEKI